MTTQLTNRRAAPIDAVAAAIEAAQRGEHILGGRTGTGASASASGRRPTGR